MNMTSQELPVFRFYDRKSKRRRHELEKTVDHTVKKFKDEKLPQEFKHRITGPSTEWKTFFRQQDAFDYARQKTEDFLHVFAYESGTLGEEKGLRMYLVATYPVFWHYYSQLKENDRHHYEVIPEGAVCKLYFDLEFSKLVNIDSDGPKMVEVFIKYVCQWLKNWNNVSCSRRDVLDLEASTNEKFSRHLIFQLKDVAFKDNINAGQFVHYIFNKLLNIVSGSTGGDNSDETKTADTTKQSTEDTEQSQNCLTEAHLDIADNDPIFNTKQDADADTLAQTKDKNDSGFESPHKGMEKIIKNETDEKPDVDHETGRTESHDTDVEIFKEFSDEELKSLVVLSKDGKPVLFCDMGVYTKNRNFRLLRSTKLGKKNPFIVSAENLYKPKQDVTNYQPGFDLFSDSLIANVKYTDKLRILSFGPESQRNIIGRSQTKTGKDSSFYDPSGPIEGYTKSPYPEIDDFISKTVSEGGKNGFIRHWTYFTQGELLIYDIARYRWCANVQRQHHSNNIMLCVDMKKGVYYQKCHDPDCKAVNFKSDDYPLPSEVLPGHYFQETGDGLDSDFDDDDIVQAAEAAEKTYQTMQDDSDDDLLSATMEMEKTMD